LAYFLNASGIVTDDLIGDGYDVAQSLRLKMANAFFKMSRSRSTRLSSASSSLTRVSREEATGPLSRSSSRFQRYNRFVPERPNRSTTDCAECPSRSICTPGFWSPPHKVLQRLLEPREGCEEASPRCRAKVLRDRSIVNRFEQSVGSGSITPDRRDIRESNRALIEMIRRDSFSTVRMRVRSVIGNHLPTTQNRTEVHEPGLVLHRRR